MSRKHYDDTSKPGRAVCGVRVAPGWDYGDKPVCKRCEKIAPFGTDLTVTPMGTRLGTKSTLTEMEAPVACGACDFRTDTNDVMALHEKAEHSEAPDLQRAALDRIRLKYGVDLYDWTVSPELPDHDHAVAATTIAGLQLDVIETNGWAHPYVKAYSIALDVVMAHFMPKD